MDLGLFYSTLRSPQTMLIPCREWEKCVKRGRRGGGGDASLFYKELGVKYPDEILMNFWAGQNGC